MMKSSKYPVRCPGRCGYRPGTGGQRCNPKARGLAWCREQEAVLRSPGPNPNLPVRER